jgi:hypothetical protein
MAAPRRNAKISPGNLRRETSNWSLRKWEDEEAHALVTPDPIC